ncbi:MAG: cysteine desulfurase [Acetobacteraceae bacterium]|nr:cysteine desulfurase [Acetobacteraceae bacterium]
MRSAFIPALSADSAGLRKLATAGFRMNDHGPATLITSKVEHPSVLRPAEAFERRGGRVIFLDVSREGLIKPHDVERVARSVSGPITLSVQWANSETGVLQPIPELVAAARSVRNAVFVHSDIAQAVGRVRIDLDGAAVDVATFSGHKLHGPPGTGALIFRDPEDPRFRPLLLGGGQERGFRAGTQNLPGAVGLGVAARLRADTFAASVAHMRGLRDEFEGLLSTYIPGIRVNGSGAPRVPNTTNVLFAGVEAMALVARLDGEGIACSLGSACSSGKPEPSHVLTAMGLSEKEAFSSVRFSFSVMNTKEEVRRAARVIANKVRTM